MLRQFKNSLGNNTSLQGHPFGYMKRSAPGQPTDGNASSSSSSASNRLAKRPRSPVSNPTNRDRAKSLVDSPSKTNDSSNIYRNRAHQKNVTANQNHAKIAGKLRSMTTESKEQFFQSLEQGLSSTLPNGDPLPVYRDERHTSYGPKRDTSNYTILNELGKGTYGVVSRAICNTGSHRIKQGTEVALKKIQISCVIKGL